MMTPFMRYVMAAGGTRSTHREVELGNAGEGGRPAAGGRRQQEAAGQTGDGGEDWREAKVGGGKLRAEATLMQHARTAGLVFMRMNQQRRQRMQKAKARGQAV